MTVDVEAAKGGLRFVILSVIGSLFGAAVLLSAMDAIREEVRLGSADRLVVPAEESVRAWRELREYRYPVHFFRLVAVSSTSPEAA